MGEELNIRAVSAVKEYTGSPGQAAGEATDLW